jgi:hypothetical protein
MRSPFLSVGANLALVAALLPNFREGLEEAVRLDEERDALVVEFGHERAEQLMALASEQALVSKLSMREALDDLVHAVRAAAAPPAEDVIRSLLVASAPVTIRPDGANRHERRKTAAIERRNGRRA